MIYVCPVFPGESGQLAAFNRLYAFPRKPDPAPSDGFCILDSGAYGLHQQGMVMDKIYVHKLASFYRSRVSENVFAIAPDEFLNPTVSKQRFANWQDRYGIPVVPVIQFKRIKRLDLYAMLQQSAFYLGYRDVIPTWQGRPFIAISNPGLRAFDCKSLAEGIKVLRRDWGDVWLHNLGAGWSPEDIRRWRDLDCFDSMDSIAYYTDALRGLRWSHTGIAADPDSPFPELALHNAQIALLILGY
jgi:hypothetical protein